MKCEIKCAIDNMLIEKAREARDKAFTPFSGFKVGAALLTQGGRIYTGCNIENLSLGLSLCAERVAMVKAISEGDLPFQSMAIVADTTPLTYPCGSCRQMLYEMGDGVTILLANMDGLFEKVSIQDLLPHAFNFMVIKGVAKKGGAGI